ncbi:MAG: hypothetical protein R3B68_01795 [Phycisphaerales bacterium]
MPFSFSLDDLRAALGALGVLEGAASSHLPKWWRDLERVLLVEAELGYMLKYNERERLVDWLAVCSPVVARHRLAALASRESRHDGVLRLLVSTAESRGAMRDIYTVASAVLPWPRHSRPRATVPLFDSRGRSAPPRFEVGVVLAAADSRVRQQLLERAVRRGDLRASVVVALEFDFGAPPTQVELVEHLRVTKGSLRHALAALMLERRVTIDPDPVNKRKVRVRLLPAPSYATDGGESCPEGDTR